MYVLCVYYVCICMDIHNRKCTKNTCYLNVTSCSRKHKYMMKFMCVCVSGYKTNLFKEFTRRL